MIQRTVIHKESIDLRGSVRAIFLCREPFCRQTSWPARFGPNSGEWMLHKHLFPQLWIGSTTRQWPYGSTGNVGRRRTANRSFRQFSGTIGRLGCYRRAEPQSLCATTNACHTRWPRFVRPYSVAFSKRECMTCFGGLSHNRHGANLSTDLSVHGRVSGKDWSGDRHVASGFDRFSLALLFA